jgi:hypothetical protein
MLRGTEQTLVDLITDDPAGLLLAERRPFLRDTLPVLRIPYMVLLTTRGLPMMSISKNL